MHIRGDGPSKPPEIGFADTSATEANQVDVELVTLNAPLPYENATDTVFRALTPGSSMSPG